MEHTADHDWQDLVARLESTRSLPDDNAFAHWAIATGVMGVVPLVSLETLPIAIPFAAAALLLGLLGLLSSVALGRGRRRSIAALLLGAAPLVTVSVLLALQLH